MSVVDHVVRHVSLAVVKSVVDIGARQASTVLTGTVTHGLTTTAAPTSQTPPPPSLSATATDPQPTDTPGDDGTDNGGTLLFFVALGFGVVFTNLWIIVGVKYCFRYNARARAMHSGTDGEPINMENMARPRRRREKKLMTMEEVNDKFPMMKYKSWVSSRALQGLPTTGGVSIPSSRANSIRSLRAASPELTKERVSTDEPGPDDDQGDSGKDQETTSRGARTRTETPTATHARTSKQETQNQHGQPSQQTTVSSTNPGAPDPLNPAHPARPQDNDNDYEDDDDDDDDDDEHMTAITAALPTEWCGTSGDTCAICIDTLEDDDDVRGLTCGHVFHAVCVDPWLLSRRACCPLCKADYYTPKPGAQTHQNAAVSTSLAAAPQRRRSSLFILSRQSRQSRPNPRQTSTDAPPHASALARLRSLFQMPSLRAAAASPPTPPAPETRTQPIMLPSRAAFRWPSLPFRRPRQPGAPSDTPQTSPADGSQSPNPAATAPTPSQLEAGTR